MYRMKKMCVCAAIALVSLGAVAAKKAKVAPKPQQKEIFVTPAEKKEHCPNGMCGDIIALWQSHGCYYNIAEKRWKWQRCRLFGQVEDLYTQSYVLPFLVPMLENSGAYVMLPRERDLSTVEVIVDNDGGIAEKSYRDISGKKKWENGDGGFAYLGKVLDDWQNPFAEGTYRVVETVQKSSEQVSLAKWTAHMPEDGYYAVYVSYKTLSNSLSDAVYTVNAADGAHSFVVNQKLGGGIWVYLGTFPLKKGANADVVSLSNKSREKGVVTADAIKIGGGMGNVERGGETSQRPRFCEGSRYFLQWSGFPKLVYSQTNGTNDYMDDYKSRAHWVNYLMGGSPILPDSAGVKIPVDMSMAFHTDAGITEGDDVIGTMGIIYSKQNNGKYLNGLPRAKSTELAKLITGQIVDDIRAKWHPYWESRPLRDQKYYESRVPEVPSVLLELLSHQNFSDMQYGLDPRFRFTVCRSIYKAMAKFQAQREGRKCVVQPLPVQEFAIRRTSDSQFVLEWKARYDALTPGGALPKKYIVQERKEGEFWWNELKVITDRELTITIKDNKIHSYRIIAANEGGKSFPSEILSLGVPENSLGTVMVVNAFDRVSGPESFVDGGKAGFRGSNILGVPYLRDISYTGTQIDFIRAHEFVSDDKPGFGWSRANYETQILAGNTFDYPLIHGMSIMQAGFAFVSASRAAVESGAAKLMGYDAVDLIFGKEKEISTGIGFMPPSFKVFSQALINILSHYRENGGNIIASGCYVASDLSTNEEREQIANLLGYKRVEGNTAVGGKAIFVKSSFGKPMGEIKFNVELNNTCYAADELDAIEPAIPEAEILMRYSENTLPAAVASERDGSRAFVLAFPIETILEKKMRDAIFTAFLRR